MSKTNKSISINLVHDALLVSIPLDLTDNEIDDLQSRILQNITINDIKGVILDISKVDIIDSFFARAIADTAQMVNIMGFKTIVCGMRPNVAITTVELGFEFGNVKFAFNINQAYNLLGR
jgi:rsbT antagonist protein RsbS